MDEIRAVLPDLSHALSLAPETKIHLGPKDSFFNGREFKQKYIGTLGELL